MKQVRNALFKLLGYEHIYALYKDGLSVYGWRRSAREQACVDADGQPVPWITYPTIDLLKERVQASFRVFEFGSGNSTLWWSRHVANVHSVEHDKDWFAKVSGRMPANVKLDFIELEYGGDYCRKVGQSDGPWDIVVVDGRDRVNCIKQSLSALRDNGVLILDNSDRTEYNEGMDLLKANGFKQLRLRGLAPLISYVSETSVFYRDQNCLDL